MIIKSDNVFVSPTQKKRIIYSNTRFRPGYYSTLENNEDSDEMPHKAAFHQGLHCLLRESSVLIKIEHWQTMHIMSMSFDEI